MVFSGGDSVSEVAVSLCSAGPKIFGNSFTVLSLKKGTSEIQWLSGRAVPV